MRAHGWIVRLLRRRDYSLDVAQDVRSVCIGVW